MGSNNYKAFKYGQSDEIKQKVDEISLTFSYSHNFELGSGFSYF